MSRWQGCWLVVVWLLHPAFVCGQQPLLTPRATGALERSESSEPLKLARPEGQNSARGNSAATRSKPGNWSTTGSSLLVVLVLIAGGAYLLRRQGRRFAGLLPGGVIQVLGRRYIDQRNCLQLIRCGSKILVLTSSATQGLTTLSEITDPLEVELLTRQCLPGSDKRGASADQFRIDPQSSYSSAAAPPGHATGTRALEPRTAPGGARG